MHDVVKNIKVRPNKILVDGNKSMINMMRTM